MSKPDKKKETDAETMSYWDNENNKWLKITVPQWFKLFAAEYAEYGEDRKRIHGGLVIPKSETTNKQAWAREAGKHGMKMRETKTELHFYFPTEQNEKEVVFTQAIRQPN